jgi:CubicO group peptidase (beta-lactamase class C family)
LVGKFHYEKAFGYRTLKDPSKPDPIQIDATMWMASCTKLVTSIAAMQCVERGQLTLDGDVTDILPELKDIEILTGFDQGSDGKDIPILTKNTKPITLRCALYLVRAEWLGCMLIVSRHLLNHSSGLSYDVFSKYSGFGDRNHS